MSVLRENKKKNFDKWPEVEKLQCSSSSSLLTDGGDFSASSFILGFPDRYARDDCKNSAKVTKRHTPKKRNNKTCVLVTHKRSQHKRMEKVKIKLRRWAEVAPVLCHRRWMESFGWTKKFEVFWRSKKTHQRRRRRSSDATTAFFFSKLSIMLVNKKKRQKNKFFDKRVYVF